MKGLHVVSLNRSMGIRGGRLVDLMDPKPSDFEPEAIARTLANEQRFAGNYGDYTVAQHAVLVAREVKRMKGTPREQFAGLHHDDTEAVTGDLPRPVKNSAPGFRDLERRLQAIVDVRYGIDCNWPIVKRADMSVFYSEVMRLVPQDARWMYEPELATIEPGPLLRWSELVPWGRDRAFAEYMDLHELLSTQIWFADGGNHD